MQQLSTAWNALRDGGPMVYPLLALGAIALMIILDRALAYARMLRMPSALVDLIETYGFAWTDLDRTLATLTRVNVYGRFIAVIAKNRELPAWWVESRAEDEATTIEKSLSRGLWVLETVVTAAPLLGLLGTITGMMQSFKIIGGAGLVAPTQVTAGVAQALIATALGLLIAILALFGFNLFSRIQSYALDRMEQLGSKLVDHIRLDQGNHAERPATTIAALASREGRVAR